MNETLIYEIFVIQRGINNVVAEWLSDLQSNFESMLICIVCLFFLWLVTFLFTLRLSQRLKRLEK